jgi:hypothetical protein
MAAIGRATLVLRIVGWSSIVFGLLGLWYHFSYLSVDYSRRGMAPYFYQAWHIMAAVNIALLLVGVALGIAFVRLRIRALPFFIVLQTLVILDAIVPGFLWLSPKYGRSIGEASGISGGTILELVVLFPLWGSIAAAWAVRKLRPGISSATHP